MIQRGRHKIHCFVIHVHSSRNKKVMQNGHNFHMNTIIDFIWLPLKPLIHVPSPFLDKPQNPTSKQNSHHQHLKQYSLVKGCQVS